MVDRCHCYDLATIIFREARRTHRLAIGIVSFFSSPARRVAVGALTAEWHFDGRRGMMPKALEVLIVTGSRSLSCALVSCGAWCGAAIWPNLRGRGGVRRRAGEQSRSARWAQGAPGFN